MKKLSVLPAFALLSVFITGPALAVETRTTDIKDQSSVEITVYNNNMGLVKDRRKISFAKGPQDLKFMGVASKIIPESVSITSLSHPGGLVVVEQNYEYDLLSPAKLLDKYVGKEIKLVTRNAYTDKEETVAATIMSSAGGQTVFKIGDEITFNHPGRIIFPKLPDNLIPRPTLMWLVDSAAAGPQDVEALYLTNGITWHADYVLLLNDKDTSADLTGWVTIDNKSGAMYGNAKLKLVAGDIHRAENVRLAPRVAPAYAKSAAGGSQFREKAFFEYHMYTLGRRTTLKDNQTKQIGFLEARNIPVKKEYVYQGASHYYQSRYDDPVEKDKVMVFIEMANRKENNLGMPLPKGLLRVYKADTDGSRQFIGEDRINHTPKDEKVRTRLGSAFDIAVERKQTHWEKISNNAYEVGFEIQIRNHKKEDVTVRVRESLPGDWKMVESSLPHKKEDAHTLSFNVPVKKDGETKLAYKVRVRF